MKQACLEPRFVEGFPLPLQVGVLYISMPNRLVAHLCCCGCGEEVITPLTPAGWSLRRQGDKVSLHPSVGNWGMPCQSHYWILNNRVVWSRRYSQVEVDRVRARDRRDQVAFQGAQHRQGPADLPTPGAGSPGRSRAAGAIQSFLRGIWNWIAG